MAKEPSKIMDALVDASLVVATVVLITLLLIIGWALWLVVEEVIGYVKIYGIPPMPWAAIWFLTTLGIGILVFIGSLIWRTKWEEK